MTTQHPLDQIRLSECTRDHEPVRSLYTGVSLDRAESVARREYRAHEHQLNFRVVNMTLRRVISSTPV